MTAIGRNPAVHGAGTKRVILSTSSAPARCPAARNKMFAHLHARHPLSSVQRMLAMLEYEVAVRRVKRLGRQRRFRREELQTPLNRRALDVLEQPRAHSATTGFRRDAARSHLMVLRPQNGDCNRLAFDLGDQAVFVVRVGRPARRPPAPPREERGGEKTALSDSPASVIAWMRLQPIGSICDLRNFGIVLSDNLESC